MRKTIRPIQFFVIFPFVLLFCGITASAFFHDYSDVSNHWAVSHLEKACNEGLLVGFDDNTMRPDAPISEAQVLTILCRILNAQNQIDVSTLGLSGNEWYANTAKQAAAINLISDASRLDRESLTRMDAFLLLSKAFQLTEAAPDETSLTAFRDLKQLTNEERRAISSLIRWGGLEGYEDHTLRLQNHISRAEFVAMLYRIAPYQKTGSEPLEPLDGGVLISNEVQLDHHSFSFPVYLDCAAESLSLQNVTAELLVVRSQKNSEITIGNGSQLHVMILSGGTGKSSTLFPSGSASIDTLIVGDHSGALSISGNVSRLEVTGSGQNITVNTNLEELIVSGSGSQIKVTKSGSIKTVKLTKDSSRNTLLLENTVSNLILDGSKNQITTSGLVECLSLYGKENQLAGTGKVQSAQIHTTLSTITLPCDETSDETDHGISELTLTLTAPETLPIGETLTVTATLQNPEEKRCKAKWIVGGTVVKEEFVTVGPQSNIITYSSRFEYKKTMNTNFQVSLQLIYTTKDGMEQTASASAVTTLENYSPEYYDYYSKEEVLKRVSTGYKGDYTLSWAQKNDYDQQTKMIWINSKEYESTTNYLIWISISQQRVNIFQGNNGHWTLKKCFLVGTGAQGTDTPVGVYTVGTRSLAGWTTEEYNVRPVVRFNMGSGLAFHSRIYDPEYTKITDPSIGYPVSHGCIRMYDEDVWWIYNSIPKDTTVVVY